MTKVRMAAAMVIGWLVFQQAGLAWALPYESVEWQEFPDVRLMSADKSSRLDVFPDWDESVLRSAEYSETGAGWFENKGMVTVRSSRLTYANLIHYAESGRAYIVNHGLPVRDDQQITFSFKLPKEERAGITRLMTWRQPPEPSWLNLLARHPNYDIEPVVGLEQQRWFSRGAGKAKAYPWETRFRSAYDPPRGFIIGELPAVYAEIDSNGLVKSKDCAVSSSGYKRLAFDEYGGFGQWMLDWGTDLSIEFELPKYANPVYAELRLYGQPDSSFGIQLTPVLEVSVNGWTQSSDSAYSDFDATAQPIALDVSQYMEAGINRVQLRLGSLADTEWLLERLELWME